MDVTPKKTRKSYSREKKLEIIQFYKQCKNQYKTCKEFGLNTKTLMRMVNSETKIKGSPGGARKFGSGRGAFFPEMEKKQTNATSQLIDKSGELCKTMDYNC